MAVKLITPALLVLMAAATLAAGTQEERPRLIVLTDISSLTAGVREPDDGQSLIRLLLYSNDLQLEGLIASANMGHGQVTRPELIRQAVDAYAEVRPNLILHDRHYPSAETLRALIKSGQPVAGRELPVEASIGEGKDTEASDWIIRVADRPERRLVWVTVWGGAADLAQALWKVRHTRAPRETARFVSRLRVHLIGDQDSTSPWIRETFPNLYVITRSFGYRGMYRGGDTALVSREWVEHHVRTGHGALGALYPNYNGGDIWSSRIGPVRGVKEGDTPSFLSLIPNGLTDLERPELGSWGGRLQPSGPNRWVDAIDASLQAKSDLDPRISAVYRWRPAFQADFQARLDWCVRPYGGANHPPVPRLRGVPRRTVHPGDLVTLDAGASTDPDEDWLSFTWSVYPQPEGDLASFTLPEAVGTGLRFRVPWVAKRCTLPILLAVRDVGDPPLTRYRRALINVEPAAE